jgi:hypothetical protein
MASAAGLASFASVVFCLWMFFTSALYRKTHEGKLEVRFHKDGSKISFADYKAAESIRLSLRLDPDSGRLVRQVGGREVRSDAELLRLIQSASVEKWVPISLDAHPAVPWKEVVGLLALCKSLGFGIINFGSNEAR